MTIDQQRDVVLTAMASALAALSDLPPSRENSLALSNLQQAIFWHQADPGPAAGPSPVLPREAAVAPQDLRIGASVNATARIHLDGEPPSGPGVDVVVKKRGPNNYCVMGDWDVVIPYPMLPNREYRLTLCFLGMQPSKRIRLPGLATGATYTVRDGTTIVPPNIGEATP